jgi:ribosomal-protein-alanine N-acetyltransferase
MSWITLETERMRLRPLTLDDADDIYRIFSDPVAMIYSITGTRSREETRLWIERVLRRIEEDGHGFLACVLKENGRYAGHAGLLLQEVEGQREIEIAYWFVRDLWSRGLATEAARALRDHGFDVMGGERLVSLIHPDNVASQRVAEKVGMHHERDAVWKEHAVRVYSMSRQDRDRTGGATGPVPREAGDG